MLVLLLSVGKIVVCCRALVPASLSHRLNVLPPLSSAWSWSQRATEGPGHAAPPPPRLADAIVCVPRRRYGRLLVIIERMVYIRGCAAGSKSEASCTLVQTAIRRRDGFPRKSWPPRWPSPVAYVARKGTCPSPRRSGGTIGGLPPPPSASRSAARGHRRPARGRAADHAGRPGRDRHRSRRLAGPTRCAPRRRIAMCRGGRRCGRRCQRKGRAPTSPGSTWG